MDSNCINLNEGSHPTGSALRSFTIESEPAVLRGEYDPRQLTEAFKSISLGVLKMSRNQTNPQPLTVRCRKGTGSTPSVVIEWAGVTHSAHDPFRSFAGSHEIKLSMAAKIVEAHGGSAECQGDSLVVTLPLSP